MDKITASEIIGEVRRSKRIYEIFEEADRILMFFAEKETYQKELEQEVANRKEEISKLDAEIASKMVNSAQIQNDLEDRMKKVDATIDRKQVELAKLVDEAHDKANAMVQNAQQQVIKLHQDIEATKQAYAMSVSELRQVQDQVRVARNELEKVKNKFLKMVG